MSRERLVYKYDKELKRGFWFNPEKKDAYYHAVMDDTIPPTVSHATGEGKIFDSKSALFEHYRQHGYECTGGDHLTGRGVNDGLKDYKPNYEEIRADVEKNFNRAKWGMAPISERERYLCQQEERVYRQRTKNWS